MRDHEMDGTLVVTRQPGMIEADAGGELLGLHVERGVCYGFNATATRIWQLTECSRSVDDLCAALLAEYDVDDERCRADVAAALTTLADERLVALTPA